MRNKVRENGSLSEQEKEDLINLVANQSIYGIDYGKDPPLARVARINMYLHGDGGSCIYYADALDKQLDRSAYSDPEIVQNMEELRKALQETRFDVILTNPPFSMTKETKNPFEKRILKQYDLAAQHSGKLRNSLRSSVMFLERYHDLLKPGGRLITVIDDTLLSSNNFRYVRDFLRSRFLIRAIISLPGDTFRQSGSRVKTSILLLQKKQKKRHTPDEQQPDWFHYFAQHVGIDDLPQKASAKEVREARKRSEQETNKVVTAYHHFLDGEKSSQVLSPEYLSDRLDLRNCVPLFGRMKTRWQASGIDVKFLHEVAVPTEHIVRPSNYPTQEFVLLKVAYAGRCEIEKRQLGSEIKASAMHGVKAGQLVFSTIRATDGAVAVVPAEFDNGLVSKTSYTVFDCQTPQDAAYLWSVLRSHEIRADMQSISPGSGRYTTYWPDVRNLQVPWLSDEQRMKIGNDLIALWQRERQLEKDKEQGIQHLETLGLESESSRLRWQASKAPK